jgi:hypothetical protein
MSKREQDRGNKATHTRAIRRGYLNVADKDRLSVGVEDGFALWVSVQVDTEATSGSRGRRENGGYDEQGPKGMSKTRLMNKLDERCRQPRSLSPTRDGEYNLQRVADMDGKGGGLCRFC